MLDLLWGRGIQFKTTQAFAYFFTSCIIIGIYPTNRLRKLYYVYLLATYVFLFVIAQIAFNGTYIVEGNDIPISKLLTSIQAGINVWAIPIKSVVMALGIASLRRAESTMDELDKRCTLPKEIAKIKRRNLFTLTLRHLIYVCDLCTRIILYNAFTVAIMGNRIIISYITLYYIYGLTTYIGSVYSGEPPYSMYIPFWDWRNSKREFVQHVIVEFFIIMWLLYHQICYDSYPVTYIYILRIHLQILIQRIENLGQKDQIQNYNELVDCVKDHHRILKVFANVCPVFSVTIFIQLFITAAILGVTMINVFIFADLTTKIACISYYIAVLMQTFPTCFSATLLIDDCEKLPLAIFYCNWFEQSYKFRKMMIYFIHQTQEPIRITALGFVPITLGTFISIAKFSFTLYTFIREMDIGAQFKQP